MAGSEEPAPPPTACRHVVSGSISLASRRAFHLSLTVLVHYRSQESYFALADGPASFNQDFSCPGLLRMRIQLPCVASPTGLSPSSAALSSALRLTTHDQPRNLQTPPIRPYNPARTTAAACHALTVWANPLSLAATQGITFCFLFLRVLRCFSSPGLLPPAYVFSRRMTGLHPSRVPPFGYPWIKARLQLPMAFRSLPRPSSPSCA